MYDHLERIFHSVLVMELILLTLFLIFYIAVSLSSYIKSIGLKIWSKPPPVLNFNLSKNLFSSLSYEVHITLNGSYWLKSKSAIWPLGFKWVNFGFSP